MATRAASLVQALILTVLTLTGNINVEIIIVVSLFMNIKLAVVRISNSADK